jgi:hypothetical protein
LKIEKVEENYTMVEVLERASEGYEREKHAVEILLSVYKKFII